MTPAEFKKKWAKFAGKESAAFQSHFDEHCRLLRVSAALGGRSGFEVPLFPSEGPVGAP
jgi:hypothetical protein